ncbi:hypothetical protein SEA_WELCOME_67 [Microbacterium phage Welcome]|nr:hypothetical protein SEA_WELCOME_67 [Microbacterium phage Welcome]URM87469.1 hypothetical protein SEA_DUSTYDINO_69 [Microbacterium phage DustyDino]
MKIPPNAKKARSAAEALGFEVFTENRIIHKPATLRKTATDEHAAGSVLYAAKDIDTHLMNARHLALPKGLAFQAIWGDGFSGRIVDESGGKAVRLEVNYYYGPGEIKSLGYTKEYAEKVGQERTARYNDGEEHYISRWRVESWGEFSTWIDGMIDVLKVDHPHISTKKKPSKKKTEEAIMHELLNPVVDYGAL